MTYSSDFRRKVLSVREKEGLTIAQVAARFDVGIASIVRWLKRPEPKIHGYRRRKIDMDALARDVEQYPDAYQSERAVRFGVHQNAICHALKKLKVSYKKNAQPSQNMRRRTAYLPDDYWASRA
jgi:transposase